MARMPEVNLTKLTKVTEVEIEVLPAGYGRKYIFVFDNQTHPVDMVRAGDVLEQFVVGERKTMVVTGDLLRVEYVDLLARQKPMGRLSFLNKRVELIEDLNDVFVMDMQGTCTVDLVDEDFFIVYFYKVPEGFMNRMTFYHRDEKKRFKVAND